MNTNRLQLDSYPALRAMSIDEVQDAVYRLFRDGVVSGLRDTDRVFEAKGNHRAFSKIEVWCCAYNTPIKVKYLAGNFIRLQYCNSGSATTTVNRRRLAVTPERAGVHSVGLETITSEFDRDFQQMTLKFDVASLKEKLAALTGQSIEGSIEFDMGVDLRRPEAAHLRRTTEFFIHCLDTMGSDLPSLVMAELEQTLMTGLLCGQAHNFSRLLEREPVGGASWQVRRAVDFIEANWNRAIAIEEIVAATGVSARSLLRAFKSHRGQTPKDFVKQVRLREARRILGRADATMNVTDVAYACGFGDLGRFSAEYRRSFGERPSETLKRRGADASAKPMGGARTGAEGQIK